MLWLTILCVQVFVSGSCFNLDVDHPVIIENPDVSQDKSYFGYSAVLFSEGERGEKWIKIGAPKGSYRGRKETIQCPGIVYHCPYMEKCKIEKLNYDAKKNFDATGNLTGALTGGSMDISYKYKTLAISAHNWQYFPRVGGEYFPVIRGGIFVKNFQSKTLQSRSPLKDPKILNGLSYYARAQTGFSLHFLLDKNELLIGAPGVYNYLGTILMVKHMEKKATEWEYEVMSPRGSYYEYAGYALSSGCFYKKHRLYYVTGLPRGQKKGGSARDIIYGAVFLFRFSTKESITDQYDVDVKAEFYGTQFGEYFGASLAAGDLNGDGLDDLIVGAPFRTNYKTGFNHGSVYVIYGHERKLEQDPKNRIDGKVPNGLLGLAVTFLGNIDNDGSGEFAVSAPQEDTSGVVYIYTYDKLTNKLLVSQTILGKNIYPGLRGFGMSFSRSNDIDDNHFSDILIGSPISGHVVLLRAKPVVLVHITIQVSPTLPKRNQTLSFKCCYSYDQYPEATLTIIRTLTVDGEQHPHRFSFESSESDKSSDEKEIKMKSKQEFCEDILVFRVQGFINYNGSISITLAYRIPENATANTKNPIFISNNKPIGKDTFCKKCPLLNQEAIKSETKLVMWDHLCGGKTCKSKLVVQAKFSHLSKKKTFILGSQDHLSLEVTVSNEGDPAFTPLLDITLPNGVYLRRGPLNCRISKVGKITCDLGEELTNEVTYSYEFNINERLIETELKFVFNSTTTTPSTGQRSVLNIALQLEREADFEVTGESKESSYIYTKEETTLIQNIFKIEKMGPSPMPEAEVIITVPYKMEDSRGIFRNFAEIREYQDSSMENPLSKCQNMTDYEISSSTKRTRRGANLTHPEDPDSIKNTTYPMFEPSNIFYINCTMENVKCVRLKCPVGPFENVQKFGEVAIEMRLNFKHFEDLLKPKESILITSGANLSMENFIQSGNRSDFTEIPNFLIIQKEYLISMWILIGSALVGFVILILLTTGLAKAGFFERKDKKKLIQLKGEALEEERFLEEMIEQELALIAENPEIIRHRQPLQELIKENEIYGPLLCQK